MKLVDTVDMMISSDYKERFKGEYYQLKIRLDKLLTMLEEWDSGTLNFIPTCSRDFYIEQIRVMEDYLFILTERAKMENINL